MREEISSKYLDSETYWLIALFPFQCVRRLDIGSGDAPKRSNNFCFCSSHRLKIVLTSQHLVGLDFHAQNVQIGNFSVCLLLVGGYW
jgi:hypothetical protein